MMNVTDTCIDDKRFPGEIIKEIEEIEMIDMPLESKQMPLECEIKEIYRKSKQQLANSRQIMKSKSIRIRNNLYLKKQVKKCFSQKRKLYFKTQIAEL
jgi:hypothetical protein